MSSFVREVADCFKTKSANSTEPACRYVGGLLTETRRKNMERMDERLGQDDALGEDNYQATQQFISTSPGTRPSCIPASPPAPRSASAARAMPCSPSTSPP